MIVVELAHEDILKLSLGEVVVIDDLTICSGPTIYTSHVTGVGKSTPVISGAGVAKSQTEGDMGRWLDARYRTGCADCGVFCPQGSRIFQHPTRLTSKGKRVYLCDPCGIKARAALLP